MKHMYTLVAFKPESSEPWSGGDNFEADHKLVMTDDPQEIAKEWAKATQMPCSHHEKGFEITVLIDGHKMLTQENNGVTTVDKEDVFYLDEDEQPAFTKRVALLTQLGELCAVEIDKIKTAAALAEEEKKKKQTAFAEKQRQQKIDAEKAEYERLKNLYGPGANNV